METETAETLGAQKDNRDKPKTKAPVDEGHQILLLTENRVALNSCVLCVSVRVRVCVQDVRGPSLLQQPVWSDVLGEPSGNTTRSLLCLSVLHNRPEATAKGETSTRLCGNKRGRQWQRAEGRARWRG